MNDLCSSARTGLIALSMLMALAVGPGAAIAAEHDTQRASAPGKPVADAGDYEVGAFDVDVWRAWRTERGRPRVVMFSTTFCAHCPALAEALADRLASMRSRAELHVIIMDREPDARHRALYSRARSLHVFDDQPQKIRHAIDPGWRGATPFVVLLDGAGGSPRLSLGAPPESLWRAWALAAAGPG